MASKNNKRTSSKPPGNQQAGQRATDNMEHDATQVIRDSSESSIDMSGVDTKRRRMLVTGASVVGGLGAVALAAPLFSSMSPSERAKAAGAPVEADISKLVEGQSMTVEWRGKPVWIVRRTPEALASLAKVQGELRDPDCVEPQQPDYARNDTRSIKPELLVMVGICTHLGCSPTYRPDIAPADLGKDWLGGFFCPCHGSKFDFSGRVYAGVPAPTNLEVPPHKYLSDSLILIGVDQGAAA